MSSRTKRKFDIDPTASDPDDVDYDDSEKRAAPQRRRHRGTPGAKKRPSKRQRRAYGGSDIDDDDEIESDDSFTERSESEEPEINPATGRSVRRATKKQIKYEESEEDEIEDTPSEDEAPKTVSRRRAQKAHPSIEEVEKPSLIVKLKMPAHASGRNLRTRTGSKSLARGKTPEVLGTRRSTRLSHDVEAPIVQLSDSGRHVNIVREGTRSPEPVIARATRGGKGPRMEHPSAIMEASQETSMVRDDSPGPLDALLAGGETQVQASKESSPVQDTQQEDAEGEDDDEEGVIQESQHDNVADESEEEGPITRGGGRKLRVCLPGVHMTPILTTVSSLVRLLPSASAAPTKAVILSQQPTTKRKMSKTSQIMARATSPNQRALQAQDAGQTAYEGRPVSLSGAGVTPRPKSQG
jgi:hypothetical protein